MIRIFRRLQTDMEGLESLIAKFKNVVSHWWSYGRSLWSSIISIKAFATSKISCPSTRALESNLSFGLSKQFVIWLNGRLKRHQPAVPCTVYHNEFKGASKTICSNSHRRSHIDITAPIVKRRRALPIYSPRVYQSLSTNSTHGLGLTTSPIHLRYSRSTLPISSAIHIKYLSQPYTHHTTTKQQVLRSESHEKCRRRKGETQIEKNSLPRT